MPRSTIARTLTLLGSLACRLAAHAQPIPPVIEISPRLPSSVDTLKIRLSGLAESAPPSFAPPAVAGNTISLRTDSALGDSRFSWTENFSLPPLSAGNYTIEIVAAGAVLSTLPINVRAQTAVLLLNDQRFGAQAFQAPGPSLANAVQLSDASGYFWFFDSSNPEVTVKILDGRLVNGYYWVFIASMTDVPFTVVISGPDFDCPDPNPFFCRDTRTYTSPAGKNMNFIDLTAFQD